MPSVPQSSSTSPTDVDPDTPPASIQKGYSCVLCAQRKVKCDKSPGGCINCTKARVACVYKAPPPPRRRKKGVRDLDVHARLRLYEDALRKLGVDPNELQKEELSKLNVQKSPVGIHDFLERRLPEVTAPNSSETSRNDAGVLFSGDGKSRYLENGIWVSLEGEFRDSQHILESSEEEDFEPLNDTTPELVGSDVSSIIFGTPKSNINLQYLHPTPLQIFKLWQIYLDNVNPLVKLFHAPSVQHTILTASDNLEDVPKNVEALLFAVYNISVLSLPDADCESLLGVPKAIATQRFRTGVQHALINASFLKTSDLMVLQALVLFLLSLQDCDSRVLWILTGIAGRIGQRCGLHRDGERLKLPPFEVEMRRRLWWQTIMVEGFAEKLAGSGGNVIAGDTRPPSNVNDSDLFPGMKELPKEHEGATEMMFFLIKCHVGEFLKRAVNPSSNFDGVWSKLSTAFVASDVKDKAIDDLESVFQHKFLQYCDPSIPWHFMCTQLAKAIIFMMRFIAHHIEHTTGSKIIVPQSEKDMLFKYALQVLSLQTLAYTNDSMRRFVWHVNLHFQWKAFIYLITELQYRTNTPDADAAWKEVKLVFENHPNFGKDTSKRALPVAISNLTLKSWDAYTTARGLPPTGEPSFIQVLRSRQSRSKRSNPSSPLPPPQPPFDSLISQPPADPPLAINTADMDAAWKDGISLQSDPLQPFQWDPSFAAGLDTSTLPDMPSLDPDQMNWEAWDSLLVDFQKHETL